MYIWLNGSIVNEAEACISTSDRGFLLGDGVFTTMKARNGAIDYAKQHFIRLKSHAERIGLRLEPDFTSLFESVNKLLEARQLTSQLASVRISVTRGTSRRGLWPEKIAETTPTLLIQAYPFKFPVWSGLSLKVSTQVQRVVKSHSSYIKSINYLDAILAKREAIQDAYQDALICNSNGDIACCSSANIFFLDQQNRLYTPSLSCAILPGVMRRAVINWASYQDIPVIESRIAPDQLTQFKGAFITNSLIGVLPINRVDQLEWEWDIESISMLQSIAIEVAQRTDFT